jgi:hypothetical protein
MDTNLLVVSWQDRPFSITFSRIGTIDDICEYAENIHDCTYKCQKEKFIEYLENVSIEGGTKIFTDKYHGLLVSTPSKFYSTDDAERYVKRKYYDEVEY